MHFSSDFIKLYFPAALLASIALTSCATYGVQRGAKLRTVSATVKTEKPAYSLFLVGDAGNADEPQAQKTLEIIKKRLDTADSKSMLIFLGDNIYPLGMPAGDEKGYQLARTKLENQLKITENYKGRTLVIPGNHDWYHGLKGLDAQEDFVNGYFNKKDVFLPEKGCALATVNLTEKIRLIVADTEWFLTDWDSQYGINKNCDIQTREEFFTALEDEIKKSQDRTVILALHHPIISSGTHAGFDSYRAHLHALKSPLPLPGIASGLNILRKTSGISAEDISNPQYGRLAARIKNLIQEYSNVIVISGHDHNLQYHEEGSIRQIISGAGSKTDPAAIAKDTDFSYGGSGFVELNISGNGAARADYFSTKNGRFQPLISVPVLEAAVSVQKSDSPLPATVRATVYPNDLTYKNSWYNGLMGERYRPYYAIPVEAPVPDLTILKGGLHPVREGGGHQSNSLRMVNPEGQAFTMRQLAKSATRFFRTVALKEQSFGNDFDGTFAERLLLDFYTSNHPYTPLAISGLAEKVGILHTNPELYYLPKQNVLGKYRAAYGDKLYMLEEQISEDPATLSYFNNAKKFEDTEDVIRHLHNPEKYAVDERAYIRARLFDMLIGDWDRHGDQWKWAAYDEGGRTLYRPIPKDRDQAFSNYKGLLLDLIMTAPALRHMKTYDSHLKDVKWLNREAYPLDLIFARHAALSDWQQEAEFIRQHLTDEGIDEAFRRLPSEVQDATAESIKLKLRSRREELATYAEEYFRTLQQKVLVTGSDNDDIFEIRRDGKEVKVSLYDEKKSGKKILLSEQILSADATKEIWIYGLNGKDTFNVTGLPAKSPNIRLIGGYDEDRYEVDHARRIRIYDYQSENNNVSKGQKHLTDDYTVNTYDYRKPMYSFLSGYPLLSYNPDDGVHIMAISSYTVNNFIRDPYTQNHALKLGVFTNTGAFTAAYRGIFKKIFGSWDMQLDGYYATPHNTQNFFGLSNESRYDHTLWEADYNRVRRSVWSIAPSITRTGRLNFTHTLQLGLEGNRIERTAGRVVDHSPEVSPDTFSRRTFANASYALGYSNSVQPYFPVFGFNLLLRSDWTAALDHARRNFLTLSGHLDVDHRLDRKDRFVLANSADFTLINNRNFQFYQAAAIGGDSNMRGYRNYRFSGKAALSNSTDLRWNLGRLKNGIAPADWGIFAGYDIGRVWNDDEHSHTWHQDAGGGVWVGLVKSFSARVQYFTGKDGGRFSAGIGLGF